MSKPINQRLFLICLLVLFSVFVGWILWSANHSVNLPVFRWLDQVPAGDKLGHFFLSGLLALLVNLCLNNRQWNIAGIEILAGSCLILVLATFEEISQTINDNRTLDWTDLVANYLGIYFLGALANRWNVRPDAN